MLILHSSTVSRGLKEIIAVGTEVHHSLRNLTFDSSKVVEAQKSYCHHSTRSENKPNEVGLAFKGPLQRLVEVFLKTRVVAVVFTCHLWHQDKGAVLVIPCCA